DFTFPRPCPAVRRALREAVLALEGLGHEVVPFEPHSDGVVTREMYWDLNTSFYISAGPYVDSECVRVYVRGQGRLRSRQMRGKNWQMTL
ncbi:unnamed protein product, partial [Symbiodinium necroappetens]